MSLLSKLNPHSIHGKFFLYLLALTVIPVTFAFGVLEWVRYDDSYNQLLSKLDSLSRSQSLLLSEPVKHHKHQQIQLNSATLVADTDIQAFRIIDKDAKTLFEFGKMPTQHSQLYRKQEIVNSNDVELEYLGFIELFLTDENISNVTLHRLYERGLMLLILLFIIVACYIALQYSVGKAIKQLLESIKNSEGEGGFVPVEWQSNDEIGQLVTAYNAMQLKQQTQALELQSANQLMESQVTDRTTSLSQEILIRQNVELELRKKDQALQTFLDGVPVMLWMLGPDDKTMQFNESWLKFTGLTLAEENSVDWNGDEVHPDYRQQCLETYHSSIDKRIPFTQEYMKKDGSGVYRWVSEIGMPRYDSDGLYLGYFGTCLDITKRKHAEQLLFEEKERAQITLKSIAEGVITTDAESKVQFINPVAEKLTGFSRQQSVGSHLSSIFKVINEKTRHVELDPASLAVLKGETISYKDATLLMHADGTERYIKDSTAPIFNQAKEIIGTVLVFIDVTESKVLTQKLSYQASHDPLTGLVNRREFENVLQRTISQVKETDKQHALLYMDLDHFKVVNDSCGHAAGDELLRQVTLTLKDKLRKSDTFARIGGDEFAVLLEYCDENKAVKIAREICQQVQEFDFNWEEATFKIGVSVGVTMINNHLCDLSKVLNAADTACYRAKNQGKGRVEVYREEDYSLL